MEKHANIVTELPGPKARVLLELREKYVPRGVSNLAPIFAEEARGALIKDVDGNTFIDFAGAIGVMNVGHSPAPVVEAISRQAEKFIHTCFHVAMYEPYVRLAEKLAMITPGDHEKKVMLANSGAEAVENAVKIARKATGRTGIVCFEYAFHGRTLMAMTLTSKVKPYKYGFGPFAPDIYRIPFAYCYRCPHGCSYPGCDLMCAKDLERFFDTSVLPENIAAVIVEPVQGEGGFIVPPPEFLPRIAEICRKNDILLIVDEIQTGFARTGKLFASEHFGLVPDLITVSKSMGAGVPISGVVGRAELMEAPNPGEIGGTYGGSPLGCVAALEVIEIIEKDHLSQRAKANGRVITERFRVMQEKYPVIGDVRGLGAMVAIELVKDKDTKEPNKELTANLAKECWRRGLLLLTAGVYGNVIRTLSPLVITDEQLNEGLDIIEEAFSQLC